MWTCAISLQKQRSSRNQNKHDKLAKTLAFRIINKHTRVNFSQGLVKRITNAHKQTIKMVNMNMAHTKTYLQGIRSVGHKHWQRTKYKWYFLSYLSLQKDTSNLRCQSSDDNEQHCRCGAYKHETKILANINVLVPHFRPMNQRALANFYFISQVCVTWLTLLSLSH